MFPSAHPRQLGRHRQRAADVIRLAHARHRVRFLVHQHGERCVLRHGDQAQFRSEQVKAPCGAHALMQPPRRQRPLPIHGERRQLARPSRSGQRLDLLQPQRMGQRPPAALSCRHAILLIFGSDGARAASPVANRTAARVANRFHGETKQSISRFETNLNAFRYVGSTRRSKRRALEHPQNAPTCAVERSGRQTPRAKVDTSAFNGRLTSKAKFGTPLTWGNACVDTGATRMERIKTQTYRLSLLGAGSDSEK